VNVESPRITKTPTTNRGTNHNEKLRASEKPLSSSSFIMAATAGSVAAVIDIATSTSSKRDLYGNSRLRIRLKVADILINIQTKRYQG
jgi:hypothetical protein